MTKIFTLPLFEKKLKTYSKKNPSLKKDYSNLLELLETTPVPHNAITLKNEVYKIRMANSSSNKGKSSGYRVYYFYKTKDDKILLFYMHSKKDEDNISDIKLDNLIIECEIYLENF